MVQLVPVWAVRYLPTVDGPSHLYNASILLRIAARLDGLDKIYMIDWHPNPNWMGEVILALLLTSLPGYIAEKLLLSGIIVLFLEGAWRLSGARDERSRMYAFLAFPLVFHQSLQFGYHNFCLGIGLYLVIVTFWWEHRNDPSRRTTALIAGLLLLSYATHPMTTMLALGSIGLLWLTSSRDVRHLVALVPSSALLAWYFTTQHAVGTPPKPGNLLEFLTHARFVFTFDERQLRFGVALFVLYVALAVATLIRGPRINPFALLFGAILILYSIAPATAAGGAGVNDRLAVILYLLPIAWFTPDMPRRAQTTLVAVLAMVAVANAIFMTQHYRAARHATTDIVRTFDGAAPHSTFIPLIFDAQPPRSYYGLLTHTHDYAAVERELIDLTNFEPELGYFPIRYRRDYPAIFSGTIDPMKFPASSYANVADYIFTWKMPGGTETERNLMADYIVVREWSSGRLYARR